MKTNMIQDVRAMFEYYGLDKEEVTKESLRLRMALLFEEHQETVHAYSIQDSEEFVDGLIDVIVIALGTLEHCKVDTQKAWDAVIKANMAKVKGVNPKRPDSNGNDLYKPDGWQPPNHNENHGRLAYVWNNK